MSHFTVVVFGDNIDKQLAPFQEQWGKDEPHTTFEDKTEEVLKGWEKDTRKEEYFDSREIPKEVWQKLQLIKIGESIEYTIVELERYHSYFELAKRYQCYYNDENNKRSEYINVYVERVVETKSLDKTIAGKEGKIIISKKPQTKRVPVKEYYKSIEEYATDWHGYETNGDKFGRWFNPNGNWDWYQIGGRWSGFWKVKENADKESYGLGEKSWTNKDEKIDAKRADMVRKKYIDIEAMEKAAYDRALERYNTLAAFFPNGVIPTLTYDWKKDIIPLFANDDAKMSRDEAIKLYNSQPAMEVVNKLKKENEEFNKHIGWRFDLEDYQCTAEEYAEKFRLGAICPFAFILDGKWYEKGDMGWFGISTGDMDDIDWYKAFRKAFDSVSDDTWVSIVDCHV